jgi:preprotein translocase subunit SecE
MVDKFKPWLSGFLLLAGVVGYYQLPSIMGGDASIYLRAGVALAGLVLALVVFLTSESGVNLIGFLKGSRIELRKMVWPKRQETVQTTLIIMVVVVLVALFLWAIDALVFNSIYNWILGLDA